MKLRCIDKISIAILNMIALPISTWAQADVLPRPFEVYGGTIGVIDAIEVTGANKTRVFASTDSANSVFYADVDHSSAAPLGTNFIFRVIPDMDANANFGAPDWIAAHQQSGKVFVGCSSGLLSCTTSSGSLETNITKGISFVLIQGARLFAVSDAVDERVARTLYYGSLDSSGNLTPASLATNFYGQSVTLAISPVDNKVYVLCTFQTNCVLLKSSDTYDAFSSATTFTGIPTTAVTMQSVSQVTIGPDGRLFLGGGSTSLEIAYSDNEGGSWTNIGAVASRSGGGTGLNIVCNGVSSAYEVYFGWVVSTNKGDGTWLQLPRPGGYRPNATHVNAGCIKVDPLNSNTIYVTTDKGVGGSTNAGLNVVELNKGLLAFQINDIDALADKSVAWIGSKSGMRWVTNFNTTPVWTDGEFPDAIVYACTIDSDDSSGLTGYAGSCRLYKTTTGGGSNGWAQVFRWEDYIFSDGEIRSVKAKGSFVALGYYSYAIGSPSGGVWYSSNGGSNWTAAITNINVNDMLMRDEGSAGIIYTAVSKSTTAERGGIYRIESSTAALDMTNDVNIRKMAEDSVGGIYASGTLPETSMPSRHHVVAYYRDTNSIWSMLTTNGLPGDFSDGEVLGRGLGPVITVGKDTATNDVPVLAVMRTIYYLPYGGSSWVTVTNYPNGTQIKTLFWDELMVGTTIGLYGQAINARPVTITIADPVIVDIAGNWYVWFSGSGYQRGGPWSLGGSGTPVTGDFDGDHYADPALVDEDTGAWSVWFSSLGYQMGGPYSLGVSGTPVVGDFDGDHYADPAIENLGNWCVWFTSLGYRMGGPYSLGVLGTPVAGDFDGDLYADPAMVDITGAWSVWFTSLGYRMGGPYSLGVSGMPVAGDFDGDGYADPAMVNSAGAWYVWYTSLGYQMGGPYSLGVSGTPLAADFDGR